MALRPGPYRFRTVEVGGGADADIGADGMIPEVTASGRDIALRPSGHKDEIVVSNDTDRPLFFVVEDRNWARDALTGERVIAMPAFRRLCPEQLLRPGDDVEIGRVAIVFTDLQGSTKLYDALGDATAFHLVRDHFAFLSERVERHNGFIVKTVGDAVMAAFHDPADAVRAVLSIQDEVADFNRGRSDGGVILKLGLHLGSCIAVTAGGVLDYFGSAVNTASRLEHQCRGGEVIVSDAVLADSEAREALKGRMVTEDSATLARAQRAGPLRAGRRGQGHHCLTDDQHASRKSARARCRQCLARLTRHDRLFLSSRGWSRRTSSPRHDRGVAQPQKRERICYGTETDCVREF